MIRLIFKRIFTQRRQNRWVVLSCFIISLLLFTVVMMVRDFYTLYLDSPKGVEADLENTYIVKVGGSSKSETNPTIEDRVDAINQIKLRLKDRNPDTEAISLASEYFSPLDIQPIDTTKEIRGFITSYNVDFDFFKIFSPEIVSGLDDFQSREFERMWTTESKVTPMIISDEIVDMVYYIESYTPRGAEYKSDKDYNTIVGNVIEDEKSNEYSLISISKAIKITPEDIRGAYIPLYNSDLQYCSIKFYIKMKSGTQLNIDRFEVWPYVVKGAVSLEKVIETVQSDSRMGTFLMVVLLILFFLFYLIFGILGSFWQRTIQRTGDIGLQLALGATPLKIAWEIFIEAMILLLIAFIPAMIVAANQYYYDVMTMGMGDAAASAITVGMFVENMLYTFLVMAVMVIIGISAPLVKAVRINPSRALMSKSE